MNESSAIDAEISSTETGDSHVADALTERLFEATIGALELFSIHIGTELGLYATVDGSGSVTAPELAQAAEIAPRYAVEWLEQQAVAALLTVDDPTADTNERRYRLPRSHRGPLLDPVDPGHVAPFAPMVAGIGSVLGEVIAAYRDGSGVAYERYGASFRHGQGGINRPAFLADLVDSWLPATAGVADRLASGGRMLDVGCGHGWSTIAVQRRWPDAVVLGIDPDRASIEDARQNARSEGVEVPFAAIIAEDAAEMGPFDVAIMLEALHDTSQPVDVLRQIRSVLSEDGILMVADEAVAESFTAPGDDLERMMFGWSVTHCLPAAMADQPSEATGTALRPGVMADLAAEAGFATCEQVPVDGGFFRIYRLSLS